MAKILFVSNIGKRVGSFAVASIFAAKNSGHEFYYAANWDAATLEQRKEDEEKFGINLLHLDLDRSPYSLKNRKAYLDLVRFINEEKIDYIHCNTPVGGLLGRLVGRKCKVKKVIYQVHGFHFYKGSPLKNWIIYYPVERFLAKLTDAIITINNEDYECAKKFRLRKNGNVYYVPGVGMDLSQYNISDDVRIEKRNELNLSSDDIALISMGDLIKRKNYSVAIEAIAKCNNPKLHYYICGKGPEESNLKKLANSLGVDGQIHFLGYRTDIKQLLKASDIFFFTSKQEGLARSLMEAMASGLPCIASNIRGNVDLIKEGIGGFLRNVNDVDGYAEAINRLVNDSDIVSSMKVNNLEQIKKFELLAIVREIEKVYSSEFDN